MASGKKPAKRRLGKGLSAMLDTSAQPGDPDRHVEIKTPPTAGTNHADARKGSVESPTNPPESPKDQTLSDVVSTVPAPGDRERSARGSVLRLPLGEIQPGVHQPRMTFDDAALESLSASIRAVGVIQPVTVRPRPSGGYELVAGERRWRAAQLAGLDDIPALVVEIDEQVAAETALIENLQREDLNPIERGDAIRRLLDRFGLSQVQVAERVGLDRSSVSNLLRLAELEEPIRGMIETGLLGLGHGKALLSVASGEPRVELAARATRESWSVRRLEEEARRLRDGAGVESKDTKSSVDAETHDVETRALEKRLGEHLGTKVVLRVDRSGKGTVQLKFFDLDHFDDLMARIGFDLSSSD